jgi:hypothetical protein
MVGIASEMQVRALPILLFTDESGCQRLGFRASALNAASSPPSIASFAAMTTSHYKPGGNSKARRRRIRALEAIWGEFIDHWFTVAKLRGCGYIQIAVAPHGVIVTGYLNRSHFFKQLHKYGDTSIKTFQASTTLIGALGDTSLSVRLQRPGYRKDGSRDLGV